MTIPTRFVAPLLGAVLTASCAPREVVRLYSGPDLPSNSIAVIVVQENLLSIDGSAYTKPHAMFEQLPLVQILPGPHTVRYRVPKNWQATYLGNPVAVMDLSFNADPGHRYYLCTDQVLDASRKLAPAMCRVEGVTPSISSAMTSTPVPTSSQPVR